MTLELYIDGNLMDSSFEGSYPVSTDPWFTAVSVAYGGVSATIPIEEVSPDGGQHVDLTSKEAPLATGIPTFLFLPYGYSLDKFEVLVGETVSSQPRSEQGEAHLGPDVLAFLLGHEEHWNGYAIESPAVTLRIYVLGPTSGSGSGSSSGSGSGSGYECPLRIVVAWDSGTGCNLPVRDGCYLLTVEEAP